MAITKKEYELMIHAVGHLKSKNGGRVKSKLSSCFRNYFAEDPDGCPVWDGLIEKGFAKVIRLPDRTFDYKTYAVTEDGFAEILKYKDKDIVKFENYLKDKNILRTFDILDLKKCCKNKNAYRAGLILTIWDCLIRKNQINVYTVLLNENKPKTDDWFVDENLEVFPSVRKTLKNYLKLWLALDRTDS